MTDSQEEAGAMEPSQDTVKVLPFGTRDSLLSMEDTQYSEVDLSPEWPAKVRVRSLTVGERDLWETLATGKLTEELSKKHFKGVKLGPTHTRAVVAFFGTLEGPEGSARLFTDPNDILALARKHSAPVTKLFNKIIELSKVTEEDMKEVEGQFDTDPTSERSTSLPKSSRSGTSKLGGGRSARDS